VKGKTTPRKKGGTTQNPKQTTNLAVRFAIVLDGVVVLPWIDGGRGGPQQDPRRIKIKSVGNRFMVA